MYKSKLKAEITGAFVRRNTEMAQRQGGFNSMVTRSGQGFPDSVGEGM